MRSYQGGRVTRLEFEVFTAAPIPDVYAYAANPENWVEWYPGTTQVEGAPAALPQVGDTWEETLKVAGLWIRFSWRATAVEPPQT